MKKFLICLIAMALVLCMILPLTSCVTETPEEPEQSESKPENDQPGEDDSEESSDVGDATIEIPAPPQSGYTWNDAVVVLSSNWNQHTYQSSDESYPVGYLTTGLYGFFFNDEVIYSNGSDPFTGYVIAPEMAAAMPVDVTEEVKALEGNPYGIPSEATKGYAYVIQLNPAATWQNGEKITADTYVYSMKELLNPLLKNYRGVDYFDGDFAIAGAKKYYYQGTTAYNTLGKTAEAWIAAGNNAADLYINMDFWGCTGALDANGNAAPKWISVTDETLYRDTAVSDEADPEAWVSAKYLYETYLAPGTKYASYGPDYLGTATVYEDNYSFDNVGIYKNDEYSITLVLEKSLTGFNLLYNLSGNWIVYEEIYEACKSKIEGTDAWQSTYCSSVETTMSYGPYKMVEYQSGKAMKFERNENWFGYTDNKHGYYDPELEEIYPMYQTSTIYCQVVEEPETRKMMFLKGQHMGYGLQAADFEEYRNSDYAHITPSETIYFLILNGYMDAIKTREEDPSFDKTKYDLETMTLNSFRRAFAVTYDRDKFASTISPSRSGGFGLIGTAYVYDPETGARYRDTEQAKKALCEFYSVDISQYANLDEAVKSISGYDEATAKELFNQAFKEALEKGYITDTDNDGKSDQTIRIEYASSATSDFIKKTLAYLNEELAKILVGTGFEGKIEIYESAPLGNGWFDALANGMSDTVLGGWSGSALNPFSLTDLYTNPEKQYDANWFDASTTHLTLEINGENITMNLKQWSDALNGSVVEIDGKQYNFGDGMADLETRLDILAAIEVEVLKTYNYIPMLQDGSVALLSKQVFYVVEEYNPVMGRGGIAYTKYNYNDAEWAAYVAAQDGGQVKY